MPIKLTAAQYKLISLAILVAALSFWVSAKYFWRTFPEASLDLRVTRQDSLPIALRFIADRGLRPEGYRHAVIFTYDDSAKLYLERSQGLERMNQLTHGPIRLWRWSHRWFRPQQEEEFQVDVTPAGDVGGFSHQIPEAQAGANLDSGAARAIAENFLSQVMKRDLAELEGLESSSIKRPARTDHVFIWKRKSVNLGDGSLRVAVTINGDQVAGYQEFIRVPEQWSRDYAKLRSRNESAQIVDEVFYSLLTVGMIVILILRLRDHDVPLRTAFGFGLVAAILFFLGQVNTFSLSEFSYRTTDSYPSFIAEYFTSSVLIALGIGVSIFVFVASAEPVYREGFPRMISLRRYFRWKGLRTRSFFLANVVGLALAFFFFGYQTVFYHFANQLGAWAPSDIPFTNQLNTALPWTAVLFTGFFPAVSEEMQFRAFAIPFLRKLFRSLPLAVILAAFNWGFLHSAYPNEPFYIRGIEVGVGGIIIGLVMLRFGIVATLIWHYSVDALYSAFLLLRSPNHYLMISGAITAGIMLAPLAAALAAYLRTGTFEDESALTNADEGISRLQAAAQAEEVHPAVPYAPLTAGRLRLAAVLIVVLIGVASIPAYRFGKGFKVALTARDAIRMAGEYLANRRIPVSNYHRVAQLNGNLDQMAVRYFLEHVPLQRADRMYRRATQMMVWEVRYFRPLQIEERRVEFDAASGQFVDQRHILDENAPGASLAMDDARLLAEIALVEHGYRLSDFELQDSRGEKRKARQDYTFVWQAKPGDARNVAEAHYRVEVNVAGDEVVSVSDSFKLPEEWERERRTTRLSGAVLGGLSAAFGIILAAGAIFLFVRQLRGAKLPWRAAAGVGAAVAIIAALSQFNRITTVEMGYSTSIPLSTFWLQTGVMRTLVVIGAGLSAWLLVALSLSLYPEAHLLLWRSLTGVWRRDALLAAILAVAASAALSNLGALVSQIWPAYAPLEIDLVSGNFAALSPALSFFFEALIQAILASAILAVLIAMLRSVWLRRPWWLWGAVALFAVTLAPSNPHSVRAFLIGWTLHAISFGVATVLVTAFFRDNLLAYPVAIFSAIIAKPLVELLSQAARFYQWNGLALALLAAVTLLWMLLPGRSAPKLEEIPSPPFSDRG